MAERLPPAGVMVFGGFILLATFFLPWNVVDGMVFSWQAMRGVQGVHAFWPRTPPGPSCSRTSPGPRACCAP